MGLPPRSKVLELLSQPLDPKGYLRLFWAAVAGKPSQQRVLELLRAFNEVVPHRNWEKPENRKKAMRKHFTFKLLDFDEGTPCFVCGAPFNHRHHVINVRNGGGNSRKNIVPLCRKCHTAVHGRQV